MYVSLDDAIASSSLVVGTSGKKVGSKGAEASLRSALGICRMLREFQWQSLTSFGEEGKGLSTDDLEKCDILLTLPTWEGYPIANLSQAVGHCVYELHRDRVIHGTMIKGVEKERDSKPRIEENIETSN